MMIVSEVYFFFPKTLQHQIPPTVPLLLLYSHSHILLFSRIHDLTVRKLMSDIITVKNLVEVYSDGTKAVDNISFNVKEGEFFGFLGPNGAGKSTTIKILTTLLRKTSGSVTVAGHDIDTDAPAVRKIIGVQSQETTVDGDLTGRENLTLQGHFQQIETSKIKQRINELLKLVELESAADKRARNYSGGMKKRLDLATALIHEPRLLFLDEPTTGLDPQSRTAIWTYLERLNKEEGTTIFLTTQYLEEADRLCKRLSIIDFGKIVASGTPAELKREVGADSIKVALENCEKDKPHATELLKSMTGVTEVMETPEGCLTVYAKDGGSLIADIVRALDSSDIRLLSVTFSSPSLDDVFLQHTGRRIRAEELIKTPSAMLGARRR
jgi:ABC-2 type transport system ATP-binding protein